ncbi:MAG: IPT/TIG domain-containing protein [Kofleriaceae bacterium]
MGQSQRLALLVVVAACGEVTPIVPDAATDAPVLPEITMVSAARSVITAEITIAGVRFGDAQGTGKVEFGGVTASITSWSDTSIVAVVPDLFPRDAPIVVTNAFGAGEAQPFRVTLRPAVYLNNDATDSNGTNTITMMAMDLATGALTEVTPPTQMGTMASVYGGCSQSIWIHEATRRLFATGATGVAVFDIHPVTGALSPVIGSPFPNGGNRSFGVLTNAAGTRVFVANFDSQNIAVFDVSSTGVLTAVPGSPFATTTTCDTLTLAFDDRFLYANYYGYPNGVFDGFAIGTDGSLSTIDGMSRLGGSSIVVRPGHNQLFIPQTVFDTGATQVSVWNIDPVTGVPTEATAEGSPFAFDAPDSGFPDSPVFTPDGRQLYIAPDNAGWVVGFTLDDAGIPTPINGSPWQSGGITDMSCEVMSRDGTMILSVGEAQNSVAVFKLIGDTPSQVVGSPFTHTTPASNASGIAITF